jgi:serine/threonine protein kinase
MGFTLDGFEIGDSIGSGGFGEVWAARQIGIDRPVAIKVGHAPLSEAKDQLRFERECKALGRLSTHPNIVTVYTSGTLDDGRPYLVLEYVDGGTLAEWSKAHTATEDQLIAIANDLAAAVEAAHSEGILHRDLKPENVLLRTTGEAVLGDFGIAQLQDGLRTATGSVTASVAYAAPEVLGGTRASEQADVYGIGICLLAAATQRTPFTEPSDESLHPVLTRVLSSRPPQLQELGFSDELNALVQSMLALAEVSSLRRSTPEGTRLSPTSTLSRIPVADRATEALSSSADTAPAPPSPAPTTPSASPPSAPPPSAVPPTPKTTPETSPSGQPLLIGALVAIVVLLGLVAFLTLRGGGDESDLTTAQPDEESGPAVAQDDSSSETSNDPTTTTTTSKGNEQEPASTTAAPVFKATEPLVVSESIEIALDFRSFPIALEAGQAVSAHVTAMNGSCSRDDRWSLRVELLDASGDRVGDRGSPSSWGCQGYGGDDWRVDEAGTYTVRFYSDDGTGTFDAIIATLTDRRMTSQPTEPLMISETIDRALDSVGWQMDLTAGQAFGVAITAMNGDCERESRWDLRVIGFGPDGKPLGDDGWPGNWGCGSFGPWTADVDGDHTFVAYSDGEVGTFEGVFGIHRHPVVPLGTEASFNVEHVIDIPTDRISYEVDLRAGQQISVDVTSLNGGCERSDRWQLRVALVDPDGDIVDDGWPGNWGCKAFGPWATEADGTHRVMFFNDSDSGSATGSFTAVIGRLGG